MTREPSIEEQADTILEKDARKRKSNLRRDGMVDRRRRASIDRIEIPMSILEEARQRKREGE